MSFDASLLTGASVRTAASGEDGGGGAGTLTDVESLDDSVVVTSPTAATRNLKWNGVGQLVDSYASVNDAPALNTALAALAARSPNPGGVLVVDGGDHSIQSQVTVPPGCSIRGGGKGSTNFIVTGNGFDAFKLTNPYGCRLSHFKITHAAPRTSGIDIHVVGGNPAIQPFFSSGGYTLSANETEIDQVDIDGPFDGIVTENNGATGAWLTYTRNCNITRLNGGDGLRIACGGTTPLTYGASFFVQRVFVTGDGLNPAASGNALNISGAGDFTIEKFQAAMTNNGLVIAPAAGARLSTGRFSLCQFDTAANVCANLAPAATAVFGDIAFDTCWFAGAGTHNVLVNSNAAQAIRFVDSFFFFAGQYGLVMTGIAAGATKIQVGFCQFSGAGTGGIRAVNARNFDLAHNQFFSSQFPPNIGMPQAVTVDAGCQDFQVTYNDFHLAAAGLLDSSGAVNKIVSPNLS